MQELELLAPLEGMEREAKLSALTEAFASSGLDQANEIILCIGRHQCFIRPSSFEFYGQKASAELALCVIEGALEILIVSETYAIFLGGRNLSPRLVDDPIPVFDHFPCLPETTHSAHSVIC